MLSTLYEQFLSNIIYANLTDIVIPIRMKSLQAAKVLQEKLSKVDMVFIDAAHDTNSVYNDLNAYWPFVKDNGGILCGDDWEWGSVRSAVQQFAKLKGLTIYFGSNFWFLKVESGYSEKNFKNYITDAWKFNITK